MTMLDTLRDDMKTAMRAGDKERLGVIRLVLAAVKQREVDDRTTLDDGAVRALIEKMIKQRRDSIEQFSAGGRDDLAEKERSEVTVLESYLPEALDEAQIDALVAAAVASTGAASMRDMGRVMGEVKSKASGRLDMALASELVKRRLSGG
jgi:uncharacterized protein YqeY